MAVRRVVIFEDPCTGKDRRQCSSQSWWVTIVFYFACLNASHGNSSVIKIFEDNSTSMFNKLIIDNNTGYLFVGAINNLYQLTPDLNVTNRVHTGPIEDSFKCPPYDCPNSIIKNLTDNINKVLVIDYNNSNIITCGSVSQGMCTVRNLNNISDTVQLVKKAIAANNMEASTVAFIAPGPPNPNMTQVMYIGVTYTGNSIYRSDVPAIASRSLDSQNMLNIAYFEVNSGTRVYVNTLNRERYLINYICGFSSGNFSYFLTTQMRSATSPSPYISKMVRLCHEDKSYYSYTEIPLECTSKEQSYNLVQAGYVGKIGLDLAKNLSISPQDDVLFAVFSSSNQSESELKNKPNDQSALCVYSLKAITGKFLQNINACFSGKGNKGLDFISPSLACSRTNNHTITEDFCGMDVNTFLGGDSPMTAIPVLTFNTRLTAITATSTGNFTVVFVGTDSGHVKKIVVESSEKAIEYGDIIVQENYPINQDLILDPQQINLYAMTKNRISKIKVQECYKFTSCLDCWKARDPYCGWCVLKNECTLRNECGKVNNETTDWMSYKSEKCIKIDSVTPNQLQMGTAQTLDIIIDNNYFPFIKEQLYCAFKVFDKVFNTNATITQRGVTCITPLDPLRYIPSNRHNFTSNLYLKTADGGNIVDTYVTFYNCSTHTSCIQCVNSPFSCNWCLYDDKCTHKAKEHCRNDKNGLFFTDGNHVDSGHSNQTSQCPSIDQYEKGSNEICIPNNTYKAVEIKVNIINQINVQLSFKCQFIIEGRVKNVRARLENNTVRCAPTEFRYNSNNTSINSILAVKWDGLHALDNPHDIKIVIYDCSAMAEDCSKCLTLSEKFSCGWCETSKSCEIKDQCGRSNEKWLNQNETCPDIEIISFSPLNGPWDGRTNITIIGKNLGRKTDYIHRSVTVAGVPCDPNAQSYESTERILCMVNITENSNKRGPVLVRIKEFSGRSKENYTFVDPIVSSIDPNCGPKSGGTTLKINGTFLDGGKDIRVLIGDNSQCNVIVRNTTEITCVTGASDYSANGKIKVLFDQTERILHRQTFDYTDDPNIELVESNIPGPAKVPTGIMSGGIKVVVTGTHFECIKAPRFYVYYMDNKYFGDCIVQNSSKLIFDSPNFTPLLQNQTDHGQPLELDYGFEMDNVFSVRNISLKMGFSKFKLFPDPHYDKLKNQYYEENLVLNGHHLNQGCDITDVKVEIGSRHCNITTLSQKQLICKPPLLAPNNASNRISDSQELSEIVIVKVGSRLKFDIGKLYYGVNKYIKVNTNTNSSLSYYYALIFGSFFTIFIIFIVFFIFYRRKAAQSIILLKNIQQQRDILELQVAAECKEAFVELQTEITDITESIACGGIPFLDYNTYAFKILFPYEADCGVLKRKIPELSKKTKGIQLFGRLILDKTFLLLFIKSLESNRYFTMQDRVNFASLIMMALQSQMEYCTDILKSLLAELIKKYMTGNNHPKLLLRRTESVAEKMLSLWFSFLLYNFLKECAGEPLYLLFRAIKQQVTKGPVDAITSEARYSLSEVNLIRQSIDFVPMTVFVSISQETFFERGFNLRTENVAVKVLDCDTISQVKEKALDTIFWVTPCRQRLKSCELDIEWITGTSCRLILYDEDSTTQEENEWKKLNTLHHYMVPDGAHLRLVSSNKTDQIDIQRYGTLNLKKFKCDSSLGSVSTTSLDDNQNDCLKRWHLVKNFENDGQKEDKCNKKMVTEVYLARLLATKYTLHTFVNDFFETIFTTTHSGRCFPLAIKYIFDFLDDQAVHHAITDPEVVHTWKSNSLPLRFWVNLIKNPDTVFDVYKSNTIDTCLSVIAQTFMDSCSKLDHQLSKDSPSSKLLYANDIPVYKHWLEQYYSNIKSMPPISNNDMNAMLAEESRIHMKEFNTNRVLCELYEYAAKYYDQLMVTLEEDEISQKHRLADKLENVHNSMTEKK